MPSGVFVTRPVPQAGLDILWKEFGPLDMNPDDRVLSPNELLARVQGRKAILCLLTDRIDARLLDAATDCKIIANMAVGYDNVDVAAATARGIAVTNTPGVLTDATADFAWALLFAAARRVAEADAYVRAGKFNAWGPLLMLGADITGRTLGIVGAGRIGSAVAQRAKGFNMRVLYAANSAKPELERDAGAHRVDMPSLLRESDFISVHVPLTQQTRHLFDREAFRAMKASAVFVNTSRGPVVSEAALVDALRDGDIAAAGLDVYEEEPQVHPGLLELPNVVLAPHIGSATHETRSRMAAMAATNIVRALRGERPPNLVNPEMWGR